MDEKIVYQLKINHLIYNDDEGLSIMSKKIMGNNFIQFICKNILHVHARRHPNKRLYILDENNPHAFANQKNNNFQKFKKLSQQNIANLIQNKNIVIHLEILRLLMPPYQDY